MATITLSTDDMTGETLPENTPHTVVNIRRGDEVIAFEIDLSDTSFKKLHDAVNKFAVKGRPITSPSLCESITKDDEGRRFAQEARQWAIATNLQPPVSERGAVPQRALDAYREHLAQQDYCGLPEESKSE